jgi:hypothetical protein
MTLIVPERIIANPEDHIMMFVAAYDAAADQRG